MKIANNILRSILISIAVITVSGVSITTSAPQSDKAVEEINRQPIVRRINFDRNINLEASWSGTIRKNDRIPNLFVLDYTEYADTFKEFRKKYPNFALSMSSEARSDSTFGEMTGDKFDDMSFTTSFFVADDNGYYRDILIAEATKTFSYSVNAIIKMGFLRKGTNLFLLPYMYGQITSHGAYNRNLEISLNISSITFHPKGT
ncbi:hypothetical protein PV325_003489 [Microctonus aethiopoides]|uniref:Uncharacterized protein n=1 Tax=Microctonus aethiopoides TaxID=144406 RepID=A0AA39FHA0_9HYME|nr:hypothetical protein PV325_003489 [Microctonus aethiopoides]KAK0169309.1 hypothetical protein PV328_012218 [Microctonus aethiopoides]